MSDRDALSVARGLTRAEPGMAGRVAEIAAAILSILWFAICLILWFRPGINWSGPGVLIWLTGLLVPIALIWVSVAIVRILREMRAEGEYLRRALADLRQGPVRTPAGVVDPGLGAKLDAVLAAQDELRALLGQEGQARHDAQPALAPPPEEDVPEEPQPSLSLGTPAEVLETPVTIPEFIGALNFPETEDDAEGFAMLRKALRDRNTQRLVRASQDALTLLSQDGIYMDDLAPDRARPEVWRAFARGERGRAVAGLGGVHDRSSLALAAGRMRQDPVFRDAVHHFLRAFDQTFMEFERHASDEDIIRLADTRTSRAFMLLGRVTGTFD